MVDVVYFKSLKNKGFIKKYIFVNFELIIIIIGIFVLWK